MRSCAKYSRVFRMQTDQLVRALVASARPVRRLPDTARRCALWMGAALSLVAASVALLGVRSDLGERAHEAPFLLENAALVAVFVLGARSAFRLSVPALDRPRATLMAPLVPCAGWLVLVLLRGATGAALFASSATLGFPCVERVLALGVLPLAVAWVMLRAAAPLEYRWTGFCAALSAFALGALGMQMLCATDLPMHVLGWHCLPVLLLALVGAGLGRVAFLRRRPALRSQ
jgi:hypothetical protein